MKEEKETKIFNWTNGINDEELQEVKKVIENDGVIIFPTDTVYGIGCNCLSEIAIEKIYNLKNRPEKKPINVLTDSIEKISKIAKSLNEKEKELYARSTNINIRQKSLSSKKVNSWVRYSRGKNTKR